MTQLPRLKVKVSGFILEFRIRSISPETFWRFSLNLTKMFRSMGWCGKHMLQLPKPIKVKVTGQGIEFTLEFRVRSISPEPFGRISLNFTQMFLLLRRCAEHMTQLPRLKVKVTGQGHVILPLKSWPHHISSTIC